MYTIDKDNVNHINKDTINFAIKLNIKVKLGKLAEKTHIFSSETASGILLTMNTLD